MEGIDDLLCVFFFLLNDIHLSADFLQCLLIQLVLNSSVDVFFAVVIHGSGLFQIVLADRRLAGDLVGKRDHLRDRDI